MPRSSFRAKAESLRFLSVLLCAFARTLPLCGKLLRYPLEFDKTAQLRNHHPLFTFQPARQSGPIVLFVLTLLVIPDLAIRAFTIPTEIAVRNRVDRQVLETAQQTILFRHAHFNAQYLDTDKPLVRIEQIRRAFFQAAACALFTHRQRQYNPSLLN